MTRLFLTAALLASTAAAAQPAPAPEPAPPPSQAASFVTIDTLDGSSRAGLSVQYLRLNDKVFSSSPTLLRFVASARYVDAASGAGGYIQAPFTYAHAKDGTSGMSDTITDVGDLEAGAIYVPKLGTPGMGLVLHAGITAPTAEDGENEALAGLLAAIPDLRDFYGQIPKGVTGRVGISPTFRQGNFFLRADLGVDWNFTAAKSTSIGQGIHYDVGAGFDLGKAAVMVESANLSVLDEKTASGTNKGTTINTIAVSARADAGQILPYIAVIVPLDEDGSNTYDFAIVGGAEFKIM